MLDTYEKHSRAKLIATIVALLVIAGVVVLADHLKSQSASTVAQTSVNNSSAPVASGGAAANSPSTANTANSGTYKDGTYTASSDYSVPHSDESIEVSLTLKNGVVTDTSIKNSESDGTSAEFQEEFAADYKSYVIGKPISSLRLSVIAGASDTTDGFNDAVQQIASKAQA
ncbi:MAG TPA: hypothetical protein VHC21_02925 [Candidatus Saccharimonadales bacterium]|nr:hypothetical protein [Candidatus Saccharimonadales bacterium]